MLSTMIFAFGVILLVTGRCPITKTMGLKGTGARLAGVAVAAWGVGVYNPLAFRVSALCGGMDTSAGVLAYIGTGMALTALVVFGLIKKFGNGYAEPADLPVVPGR